MSTNLPRVVQKIFGANADTDDAIAQFGSVIAGQPYLTGDIEEIQALNAWKNGWVGSTITNKRYPTSEETTGINKVVTQQIAYILQKGLPEWSAEETYYTNSFCQMNGMIYASLIDNNIGNIPTVSMSAWKIYGIDNSVTRSVGELTIALVPLIEAGLHLLDGDLLEGNGIYGEFVNHIARCYNSSNKIPNVNLVGLIRENSGVLSNFSADGYAILPNDVSLGSDFEIVIKATTGDDVTTNQSLFVSEDDFHITIGIDSTEGGLSFNIGDGSQWLNPSITSVQLSTNTTYWFKITLINSIYSFSYSTDGVDFIEVGSLESTVTIPTYLPLLGIARNIASPWLGTVDLNESHININGKRWWNGVRVSWTVDEETWQSSIIKYGVCGRFVYDPIANAVRLPQITGIIEGTTDINALGDLIEAGLPDITGTVSSNGGGENLSATGAFKSSTNGTWAYAHTRNEQPAHSDVRFKASDSNPIYGNNTTVQPQTIKLMFYICVATATKTDIQVDIDRITTDLNNKIDKSAIWYDSPSQTLYIGAPRV